MATKKAAPATRRKRPQAKKAEELSSDILLTGEDLVAYLDAGSARMEEQFLDAVEKRSEQSALPANSRPREPKAIAA